MELTELPKYIKNKYLNGTVESCDNKIIELKNRIAELEKMKLNIQES
jgi:hypothetical protein